MKIAIIGGGPAGLYAAILLKKQRPQAEITVYERNRADDTFGFGVVFSDATLDNFEKYDPPSYRRITQEFAYWDDIAVHFRGTVHRVGGNGFCGCSRRTLLLILQERARELGVTLLFETDIDDEGRFADADLIVLADGINSRFRDKYIDHFQPQIDLRSNKFAWMGSTKPLDAFTFIFQETEWGPFIAHAYQYEAGRSTWIFETDAETFQRAGLEGLSEQQSADRMAEIFGWFLDGHPLLINRSMWRNFPMIRSQRWVKDNMVLLGDAKATAHFSIGSGTKLAMEDAIALADAMAQAPTVDAALQTYEHGRREEVEKTQHAADVSLVWFEHVDRFWDFDPVQFAFGVMTRAKAITYDNLTLRAPEFVREVDKAFAKQVRAKGFDVDIDKPAAPMFQPLKLREMEVANRAVVSPMCMYSAKEGVPGDFHLVHYGSRAIGGAGLIFTEMTCVGRDARITPGCTGLWNDEQQAAWTRIVDFVHANSAAKDLPAARTRRPQGRDQIDVGGHGPAAGAGRLGHDLGVAIALLPRQPGAARDGSRRDGPRQAGVRGGGLARRGLRLRHAGAALRPRLSAGEFHLAADQHSAPTNMAARSPTGCAIRWKCSRRCARHGRRTSRCRCASPPPTGPRAASPATMRWRSRARSARPASIWSMSPRARPCATRSRSTAGCSRRRSPIRSATRPGSRPCASATSPPQIRSTPSSPPAAPTSSRSAGRIWSIRRSRCGRRPGTAPISPVRRNICPARSRSSATACATGRISRTSKLRVSRKPAPS